MSERLSRMKQTLADHGQAHLLAFWDELGAAERQSLLDQIDAVDPASLDELIRDLASPDAPVPAFAPPSCYGLDGMRDGAPFDAEVYRRKGEELLRNGAVAAFTVAGGQGTRLGWNGPKGTYPATVVTGKPLFRCFAEQILAAERKYRVTIPWYIMTSPMNDDATRSFFADNNCFGLERKNIFMFPQGVMPSLTPEGRMLLSEKGEVAVNPDGHGGSIRALRASGAVEDLAARGVSLVSYFQVDNPLVKVIDPLFVGLHACAPDSSGEMSSKMVAKTDPAERVGVFVRATDGPHAGKTMVVEYSDLDDATAAERDDDGRLRYRAGSVAIHLISVDFVKRLTDEGRFALPYHHARKRVPHVDIDTGGRVDPPEPNAIKLETFVFDALPLAESSIVLETERSEEFAPIKNAEGADSPETSHRLQTSRAAGWLERRDVQVPRDEAGNVDARIEISPLTALDPEDLGGVDLPERIERGAVIVL